MMGRLLWKEWKENLWKLSFGVLVSGAFAAMLLRLRIFPDQATVWVISFVQMLAVPVIYALDIFSGEMSNRTILLLFNLPAARWKIFLSKYLVSILGIVLIFLCMGLLTEAVTGGREADAGGLMMHLSPKPLQSVLWNIPVTHRPDRTDIVWDTSGRWALDPIEPLLTSNRVFLTDGSAISSLSRPCV